MTEKEIIDILMETGPMTGAQLVERTGVEVLSLWQACRRAPAVRLEGAGRRFLRLDRNVQGYARLSPSIRREFLTYTFIGLDSQTDALRAKAETFKQETKRISQAKREVAERSIASAIARLPDKDIILARKMIYGRISFGLWTTPFIKESICCWSTTGRKSTISSNPCPGLESSSSLTFSRPW
jgi:hypothetical protein